MWSFVVIADPQIWEQRGFYRSSRDEELFAQIDRLGTSALPDPGGQPTVAPSFALVAGDLVQNAADYLFSKGDRTYLPVMQKLTACPIFEGYGNHDIDREGKTHPEMVVEYVASRNLTRTVAPPAQGVPHEALSPARVWRNDPVGGHYSFDCGSVHFICLNLVPSAAADAPAPDDSRGVRYSLDARSSLAFLEADLASLAPGRPLVIFDHIGLDSGVADFSWAERDAFGHALAGRNLLCMYAGHLHGPGQGSYQAGGVTVRSFRAPAAFGANNEQGFLYCTVDDATSTVTTYAWLRPYTGTEDKPVWGSWGWDSALATSAAPQGSVTAPPDRSLIRLAHAGFPANVGCSDQVLLVAEEPGGQVLTRRAVGGAVPGDPVQHTPWASHDPSPAGPTLPGGLGVGALGPELQAIVAVCRPLVGSTPQVHMKLWDPDPSDPKVVSSPPGSSPIESPLGRVQGAWSEWRPVEVTIPDGLPDLDGCVASVGAAPAIDDLFSSTHWSIHVTLAWPTGELVMGRIEDMVLRLVPPLLPTGLPRAQRVATSVVDEGKYWTGYLFLAGPSAGAPAGTSTVALLRFDPTFGVWERATSTDLDGVINGLSVTGSRLLILLDPATPSDGAQVLAPFRVKGGASPTLQADPTIAAPASPNGDSLRVTAATIQPVPAPNRDPEVVATMLPTASQPPAYQLVAVTPCTQTAWEFARYRTEPTIGPEYCGTDLAGGPPITRLFGSWKDIKPATSTMTFGDARYLSFADSKEDVYVVSDQRGTWPTSSELTPTFPGWPKVSCSPTLAVHDDDLHLCLTDGKGSVFLTRSPNGTDWEPPNAARFSNPPTWAKGSNPSLCSHDRRLYLGLTNDKGEVHLAESADGTSWSIHGPLLVPLNTGQRSPTLSSYDGRLVMCITDKDGRIYVASTTDPSSWPPGSTLSPLYSARSGARSTPSLAPCQGALSMCSTDSSGRVYVTSTTDPDAWPDASLFGTWRGSTWAPTLAVDGQKVAMCFLDGAGAIRVVTSDDGGRTWPVQQPKDSILQGWKRVRSTPVITWMGDALVMCLTDSKGHIFVTESPGGVSAWPHKGSLKGLWDGWADIKTNPSLAWHGGHLVMVFTDSSGRIYVATSSSPVDPASWGPKRTAKDALFNDMRSDYTPTIAALGARLWMCILDRERRIQLSASDDGGETWSNPHIPPLGSYVNVGGVATFVPIKGLRTNPSVCPTPNGGLGICLVDDKGGIYTQVSDDAATAAVPSWPKGLSWGWAVDWSNVERTPSVTLVGNEVVMAISDRDEQLHLSRSTDGTIWGDDRTLAPLFGPWSNVGFTPSITAWEDGLFMALTDGAKAVYATTSTDGERWSTDSVYRSLP